MTWLDRSTLRVALTLLLVAAVLAFFWMARATLLMFLFAILFAYLLEPLVSRLQRLFRGRRGLAIATVYFVGLLAIATLGAAFGPKLVDEGRKLVQLAPDLYEKISSGSIAQQVGQKRGWSLETQARVQELLAANRERVLGAVQVVAQKAGEVAGYSFWILLIPILAVFFLYDRSRIAGIADLIESARRRKLFREVLADLDEMLAHFVRGQLYLGGISAVAYAAALSAMRVPYGLVLAVIGGMLEFIPIIGPLTTGAIMLVVSFTLSPGHTTLWLLLFLVVWRLVQDYVIAPRVLGKHVSLHPLLAIFGVLVGGEIAGVAGIYLSVPVMAAVRILWIRLRFYRGEALAAEAMAAAARPAERGPAQHHPGKAHK